MPRDEIRRRHDPFDARRRAPAPRSQGPVRSAGTTPDDVTNATNRSPYPTLHLIRESSIDRAVQAFPEAEAIYEVNMATLEKLGPEGWAALGVGPTPDESEEGKRQP